MRYVVVDQGNLVINVILWDGVADYPWPEGCRLLRSDSWQIGDVVPV